MESLNAGKAEVSDANETRPSNRPVGTFQSIPLVCKKLNKINLQHANY
jgi:hypothetical protein